MQPGYPGSGQEPYGTQPPYRDPYAQPHYSSGPQDERNTSLPADDQPEAGQEPPYAAAPIPPVAVPPQRPAAAPAPPPTSTNANTVGLIGMVLGVLSVPSAFCTVLGIPIAVVFGLAGVVLGIIGLRKARRGEASNRAHSIAAVIAGAFGLFAALAGAAALAYNSAT